MVLPIVRELYGVLCERRSKKKGGEQDGKLGELVLIYDLEKARNLRRHRIENTGQRSVSSCIFYSVSSSIPHLFQIVKKREIGGGGVAFRKSESKSSCLLVAACTALLRRNMQAFWVLIGCSASDRSGWSEIA